MKDERGKSLLQMVGKVKDASAKKAQPLQYSYKRLRQKLRLVGRYGR